MKARVKATGATVFVRPYNEKFDYICDMAGERGVLYNKEQLEFPKDEPDYWEKLKHKYAGMAMQGILSNTNLMNILGTQKGRELDEMVADLSLKHAKALVEKLKNEK